MVTTLRVVWIEIQRRRYRRLTANVTTLRVVWIEIINLFCFFVIQDRVTTLRVVWIEIMRKLKILQMFLVTTLRVVWIEIPSVFTVPAKSVSPPCGWCGLKCTSRCVSLPYTKSPPCGWCGLKLQHKLHPAKKFLSPPCGWCGLKSLILMRMRHTTRSHHLAGGVD